MPKNSSLHSKKLIFFWIIAFVVASFILANSQFKSSSNDSKYYTQLVVRYHDQSLENVLTHKWGENYWGFEPNSYDFDNFPGQLLTGVAATKLGAPPEQALHILGMVYQVLSIFLLVHIAQHFIAFESASVLFYSLLLTPMAFSYNIRANHELGIMFYSFLSLYAGLRLSNTKWWGLASIVSSAMLLWIKGPFFIFGLAFTCIGYFLSPIKNKKARHLLFTLTLSVLLIVLSALGYNELYKNLTGENFLLNFWKIQIEGRQVPHTSQYSFITLKLYNFYYYFWHYLVYALPWTLFLIVLFIRKRKEEEFKNAVKNFLTSRLSVCLIGAAFTFLMVFTINSRHAARYVFPAYYLFSAWAILMFLELSPYFKKIHKTVSKWGIEIIAPLLWFAIFSLHFLF